MNTITIPSCLFRANASYQRHVAENGHIPGVLSGAEIRGRARRSAHVYHAARDTVRDRLAPLGVRDGLILARTPSGVRRWTRVWIDAYTRAPIQIRISESAA